MKGRFMDDESVTAWAVAAQRGDHDAAVAFIRATTSPLRRLLTYLADPGDLDDLVQDTYLRAFAALARYRHDAPARLWLFAIARNVAADQVRRNQRRPRTSGDWEVELDKRRSVPEPAGLVALRHAVAGLDRERREAFVLTRVAGLSYEEAAVACGCPVGTIRSRVFRARAELIAQLGDEQDSAVGIGT
jgi:RNA polymerase sigma-70 factor (ECF subfamily)